MAAVTIGGALSGARPLRDSLYGDLIWSRPGMFRRELRLESGSELLAGLRWEKLFSFEAVAESAEGRWIIGRHRRGSWHGGFIMREAGTGTEVAAFRHGWRRRGALRFAAGAEFTWEREGFWRSTYFWKSAQQGRLMAFKSAFAWKSRFEMAVEPAARQVAELPALVLLGGYLLAMIVAESHAH
jgi:hypothetical protein